MGLILNKHLRVITGHSPRHNLQFMLQRNLPQDIPDSTRHLSRQDPLAVLGTPDQVDLQIRLRICPELVTSPGDTYYLLFA